MRKDRQCIIFLAFLNYMYNRKSHHFKILDNESKRQNFINGKNGRKIFNIEEIKKIIG